jgi:hypothetical protein
MWLSLGVSSGMPSLAGSSKRPTFDALVFIRPAHLGFGNILGGHLMLDLKVSVAFGRRGNHVVDTFLAEKAAGSSRRC